MCYAYRMIALQYLLLQGCHQNDFVFGFVLSAVEGSILCTFKQNIYHKDCAMVITQVVYVIMIIIIIIIVIYTIIIISIRPILISIFAGRRNIDYAIDKVLCPQVYGAPNSLSVEVLTFERNWNTHK